MNSKYKSEVDYGIDIPYDFADDKKSLNNYLSEVKEIVKLHDHENHGELQAFLNRLYKKTVRSKK
jgi:hypothetical protein